MTKIDDYGNQLFESARERFITSRDIKPPYWIPYEVIRLETETTLMVAPLNVWVLKSAIIGKSMERVYLTSEYIEGLIHWFTIGKDDKQNARVILEHLNQDYEKKGGLAPENTALP